MLGYVGYLHAEADAPVHNSSILPVLSSQILRRKTSGNEV